MRILTTQFEESAKQKVLLERSFKKELKQAGWLRADGKLKKHIPFKTRNMQVDNIEYDIHPLCGNAKVMVLDLDFDVRFKTDKEEAVRHKSSQWTMYSDAEYNISTLHLQIANMTKSIKKQLVFTDRIDPNLFEYHELANNGWEIVRSIKPTKK